MASEAQFFDILLRYWVPDSFPAAASCKFFFSYWWCSISHSYSLYIPRCTHHYLRAPKPRLRMVRICDINHQDFPVPHHHSPISCIGPGCWSGRTCPSRRDLDRAFAFSEWLFGEFGQFKYEIVPSSNLINLRDLLAAPYSPPGPSATKSSSGSWPERHRVRVSQWRTRPSSCRSGSTSYT